MRREKKKTEDRSKKKKLQSPKEIDPPIPIPKKAKRTKGLFHSRNNRKKKDRNWSREKKEKRFSINYPEFPFPQSCPITRPFFLLALVSQMEVSF
jgi:hypothetical protein